VLEVRTADNGAFSAAEIAHLIGAIERVGDALDHLPGFSRERQSRQGVRFLIGDGNDRSDIGRDLVGHLVVFVHVLLLL
jgi:hypothetical protein